MKSFFVSRMGLAVAAIVTIAAPVLAEVGRSEKVGHQSWSEVRLVYPEGHYLFAIQGDDCFRADLDTEKGDVEKVAGEGWKRTRAIVATTVHHEMYVVSLQGGDCFVTNVASGKDAKIELESGADFANVRCMDINKTKFYCLAGKHLWETDLDQDPPTSRKICPDEDWASVRFMEIMGDHIYTVDDHLWRTPLDGSHRSKQVGDGDWSDVVHFCCASGAVYSIKGKHLRWTDAEDGTTKHLGEEDWTDTKFFVGSDNGYIYSIVGKDLWKTETK